MSKITPFLWFDHHAFEAAEFYVSIFPHSKIISHNPMVVVFEIDGQQLQALNGGPQFKFTEAISFVIDCADQGEVDQYWEKLIADGGVESQCGWLKDKFGLSWQVVPRIVPQLMSDPVKGPKAMEAILKMKKLIVRDIEAAANG